MKVIMDADCLIKLTKAQIKEDVCNAFEVIVPSKVHLEIMVNASMHPECLVIQKNMENGKLNEVAEYQRAEKGEGAVLSLYQGGGYAGVASDDKRFINRLKVLGVPYITPAVFIVLLAKQKHIMIDEAFAKLENLSHLVSDDEVSIVKLKLETLK
jgi:rRNA-processing protein FCF1